MNRSEEENEKLPPLVQKLFAGWAKKATVDEVVAYATSWRELTLPQIEAAVDRALMEWHGDFPPCASHVKSLAPTVAALGEESKRTRDCRDCSGTGYRIVQQGTIRRATLCSCVSAEGQAKYQEWLGKKAS